MRNCYKCPAITFIAPRQFTICDEWSCGLEIPEEEPEKLTARGCCLTRQQVEKRLQVRAKQKTGGGPHA